jgi:hypothetical protein
MSDICPDVLNRYNGDERVYTWDALSTMIESEYAAEVQEVTQVWASPALLFVH